MRHAGLDRIATRNDDRMPTVNTGTRREFLRGMAAAGASGLAAKRPPNVAIVLTDDQGYGDFSCHGNPVVKTPNIDRLRGQSIRLTDFHVTPMCTPTLAECQDLPPTLIDLCELKPPGEELCGAYYTYIRRRT